MVERDYASLKISLVCVGLFCLSILMGVLICRIIITDEVLVPIGQSLDGQSLAGFISQLSLSLKEPLTVTVALFAAGFTAFARHVFAVSSLLRGASLGYAAGCLMNGSVSFRFGGENSLTASILLYLLSSAVMLTLGYFSVSYSKICIGKPLSIRNFAKYAVLFLVLSGVVIVCETVRIFLI